VRWLRLIFLLIGAVALTWLIVHIGPATIAASIRQIGWGLAIGALLHGCGLALDAVALRILIVGERPRYLLVLRACLSGHAINDATPGGKLGEITKFAVLGEAVSRDRSAAALVAENLLMFVVNSVLIFTAPPLVVLVVGGPLRLALILAAAGFAFLVAGVGVLFILTRGVGRWPFRLLGLLRVSPGRVERWQRAFGLVEAEWRQAARDRRSMTIAWIAVTASRLCNVAEAALYYGLAGGDHVIASGFLSLASSQAIGWVLFFVPYHLGTIESGSHVLFTAAGLSGPAAVAVELARKLRRLIFIALGVALLALTGWRKRDLERAAATS
jgi:hypothetical protein